MFSLTTLAAASLALTLEWNAEERWFLGLTLGGTLLGIAIARMFRRGVWTFGILAGTFGGAIAVGVIGQEWLRHLEQIATLFGGTPEQLAELQSTYIAASVTTLGLSAIVAALVVACFRFFAWGLNSGEQGLAAAARRHPLFAAAAGAAVGLLVLGAANFDFVRDPFAWSPRHYLPEAPAPWVFCGFTGMGRDRDFRLSRNGQWLMFNRTWLACELYRLDPQAGAVQVKAGPPGGIEFPSFDCDRDRLAFVVRDETLDATIYVIDLVNQTETNLPEPLPRPWIRSLQWLPGGTIVAQYQMSPDLISHSKLSERGGRWMREDLQAKVEYHARSGQVIEFSEEELRVFEDDLARLEGALPSEMLERISENDSSLLRHLERSPNGRFLLWGDKIYDRERRTVQDWQSVTGFKSPRFFGFTPRGQALLVDEGGRDRWPKFLLSTPCVCRFFDWLRREPVHLIDPATGEEVARTRPLESPAREVTVSHDGSRIAVLTYDGAYVFDVPEELR